MAATPGLTVAQYAEAKLLDPEKLRAWGVEDDSYARRPAVRLPYWSSSTRKPEKEEGRWRISLNGDNNFRWTKGVSAKRLYGWDRVDRSNPTVLLVEGESDCHALWTAGFRNVLGVPGVENVPDSIAKQLEWAETVYAIDEQDDGSPRLLATLAARLGDTLRIVTVRPDAKDFSDLWVKCEADRQRFAEAVRGILETWREPSSEERKPSEEPRTPPRYRKAGSVGALADGHRPTDVGNAERLIEAGGGRIRYVHAWGRWLVNRDGRWQLDPNNALIRQVAKKVARKLFQLAADTQDKAERDAAWAWAKRSETSGAITAMVDLARGDPRVLTDHNLLDADPWLLNCRNGTVDLRTGQLRDHDPSDLITMTTGIDYDPDATSELWTQCLKTWQPDPGMRDYLQRVAGAGATGHPTQTLQIDHGEGANGKTVFYSTVAHSLGDYAGGIHKSLLIATRHEQHDTVRADLFRRRLAVASETTDGHRLDEEKVKALTGGDPIKARRMREDLWEFNPTHTIVLHSNYKPTVSGTNHAIWRRLRLVPWTERITDPDEGLADKLREEAAAVLAWTVQGAVDFIAKGLDTDPPEQVRTATADYRRSQDILGRFTDEVLEYEPGAFTFSQTLKQELEQWADAQGLDVPAFSALTAELAEHGCESGRNRTETGSQKRGWRGVRIKDENPMTRENTGSVTDSDTPSHSPTETPSRKGDTEGPSQGVTEEELTFADARDLLDDYDTETDRIAGV